MELSIGEMLVVALAIIVLFGPNKLPQIARDLGAGIRKMKGAVEDMKTEIMKETDNPVAEIKKEIEKVKEAAKNYDPTQLNEEKKPSSLADTPTVPKIDPLEDEHYQGPVSR